MTIRPLLLILGLLPALTLGAGAAETAAPPAAPAPPVAPKSPSGEPLGRWVNAADAPMRVDVPDLPEHPVFVQTGADGRPFRLLPAIEAEGKLRLILPAKGAVELWDRPALAMQVTGFGNAARWGALPRLSVGPVLVTRGAEAVEGTPWSDAAGRFRAYPNAAVPVTVRVRNDGIGMWTRPRVELFAPDNWEVSPPIAEVVSEAHVGPSPEAPSISSGERGVLPPTATGTASFTVRIPDTATQDITYPLVAFLRFDARGETLTVQNSVDVTVEPPIARDYGMNEAGTKFVVHMLNRFAPAALGAPAVEIGVPANATWQISAPALTAARDTADAVAVVNMPAPGGESIRVPVVVSLNGYRMGGAPMVYGTARYGGRETREDGVRVLPGGAPATGISVDGACFGPSDGAERSLAFDVDAAFAVSDPARYVSPTWVTVTLENLGATRIRVEYDAWGSTAPAVAADTPLASATGSVTQSFLLPDARFGGGLPGGADLRLILQGGDACLRKITVAKWNPLKTAG